ncbi:unnamed protein product [Porites lobata]|uniref:Ion transport domain-containing protein n=1 Tax=Porites lobata TaxID=104759 RepID=A0ABN8QR44_9CNID|nr:unnamed protein product [Porites lobata]
MVTAENLCSCRDPINMAFQKVNCALQRSAMKYSENTVLLNKLAEQTEDFAVQLIDQVSVSEELVIRNKPDESHRYASLLSPMTDDAIKYSQKKFVSHPLLHKRLEMRWKHGLPEVLKLYSVLLWLVVLIDTALTPFVLPLVIFAFYRDQKECRRRLAKAKIQRQKQSAPSLYSKASISKENNGYYAYCTSPCVTFLKEKLGQWAFIVLHCRVCLSPSTVTPMVDEYLIFVFFCGMALNEYQQYKKSPRKYFKDMWNYLDVIVEIMYVFIVILRITTIARGGIPYNNRLLEISNYLYGINTLLMVLRVSSILELSPTIGPLQLALYRMCGDLLIIVSQYCFVILGFSMAITKSYKAELSYLTPPSYSGESVGKSMDHYRFIFFSFRKAATLLMWSVFEQTDLKEWRSSSLETSDYVSALFLIYLVFSVIMLVNMLIALLTKTYDNITNNKEVEWKFSRAVVENQYRGMHSMAVPFNLLSVPLQMMYWLGRIKDARKQEAICRQKEYRKYYQECLFPVITKRYKKKYGGLFPLSVEEKMDLILNRLDQLKIPAFGENPSVSKSNQFGPPYWKGDRSSDSVVLDLRSSHGVSPVDRAEVKRKSAIISQVERMDPGS